MPLKKLGRYEQLILRGLQAPSSLYEVYCQISKVYQGYSVVSSSVVYRLAYSLESKGLIILVSQIPIRSRCIYQLSKEGFNLLNVYVELDLRVSKIFLNSLTSVGNTEVRLTVK